MQDYDVIIIGSGVGGSVTARRLAENGARVLILERGEVVPREPENWSVETVFFQKKYKAKDSWLDRNDRPFDPGMYYNVGGSTKFYGAALFRLRERDFEALEHHGGVSPAWPMRSQPGAAARYCPPEACVMHNNGARCRADAPNWPSRPVRGAPDIDAGRSGAGLHRQAALSRQQACFLHKSS